MPGTIVEKHNSREFSVGPGGGEITYRFFVYGTQNPDDVITLANTQAPLVYLGVPRGQVRSSPVGYGLWDVEIPYQTSVKDAAEASVGQPPTGSETNLPDGAAAGQPLGREYTFSTGGGTVRVKQALVNRSDHGKLGNPAPKHNGLINVTRDGVEGVDIVAPGGEFTISKRLAFLSWGYFKTLLDMTATTNNAAWGPFKEDEALFLGADAQYKDGDAEAPWSMSFRFRYEPTDTEGFVFGDVVVPAGRKHGHYYMWVEYAEKIDAVAKRVVSEPIGAHIEQVYRKTDFNKLGI